MDDDDEGPLSEEEKQSVRMIAATTRRAIEVMESRPMTFEDIVAAGNLKVKLWELRDTYGEAFDAPTAAKLT